MRSGRSLFIRGIALAMMFVLLCPAALANSGKETDSDGGVWDWDAGTYTTKDGRVVQITQDDGTTQSGTTQTVTPETTVTNADGTITVINTGDEVVQNPDGSITVESGQLQVVEEKKNEMSGDEVWQQGMGQAAIRNGTYTPTYYFDGTGYMDEVAVEYMGVYRSMVVLNGEETLVNTANLIWVTEAPQDKVLAVVNAKTYARLYAKSSKKSLIMDKVYCGTVLRVLDTDKNWTFVDYNGVRGYIQTASLRFYENEERAYRSGYVATRSGHTYGDSTVHVRNEPKGAQREEYRVGTPITVFEDDGDWCRIEVQGHMCYISREFMVYEE